MSSSTINHVLSSRRQSTNALYDLRWKSWFEYCRRLKVDPIHPSVPQFTDFLQLLFEIKKLSPITIAGYRSAIALTISLTRGVHNPKFSTSIIVTHMLDGMKRAYATVKKTCPGWDISVVLSFLRDTREPLNKLPLRLLT